MRYKSKESEEKVKASQAICAIKSHERGLEHRQEYYKNPKKCLACQKPISYEYKSKNNFCSHSCCASYNNHKRIKKYCINCGSKCKKNADKYCSKSCMNEYINKERIKQWKEEGKTKTKEIPSWLRNHLINIHNNRCEECGWGEINPKTGIVPLQIHHIDGNYKNNKADNLKILCPNCHSLTPTYGGSNKGNGREYRYKNKNEGMV